MKEIKAILQPHVLSRVIHALHELPHFPGLTVLDALGQGRGRGQGGTFVLTDESLFFTTKSSRTTRSRRRSSRSFKRLRTPARMAMA